MTNERDLVRKLETKASREKDLNRERTIGIVKGILGVFAGEYKDAKNDYERKAVDEETYAFIKFECRRHGFNLGARARLYHHYERLSGTNAHLPKNRNGQG